MFPSLVRVIDRKFDQDQQNLTLIVDLIKGQPKKGEGIFLKTVYSDYFIIIKNITKSDSGQYYELFFEGHPWVWTKETEQYIKAGKSLDLCSITPEDFQNLTIQQKIDYFSSIADLIGVGRVPFFIKSNIRSSIHLILKDKEGEAGLTKFGGLPLAPENFVFPKDAAGKSALFIGQIHIGELNQWFEAAKELEGKGILYFFGTIKVKEEGQYHNFEDILVYYSEKTNDLTTADLPGDLRAYGVLAEKDVMVMEDIAIPPALGSSLWPGEKMSADEFESYCCIEDLLVYHYTKSTCLTPDFDEILLLLGHPIQIQGCVLFETELKHSGQGWYHPDYGKESYSPEKWEEIKMKATPMAKQWRLLFEFNPANNFFRQLSNFNGYFNQSKDGSFYVIIKQEDLNDLNFSATETIYQNT